MRELSYRSQPICSHGFSPDIGGLAQGVQIRSAILVGESPQLAQTRLKQRFGSLQIPARIMMERGSELNHALQEQLVSFPGDQPQLFPNLMRFEKFRGIEENDSLSKFLILEFVALRDGDTPSRLLAAAFIIAERFRGSVDHEY